MSAVQDLLDRAVSTGGLPGILVEIRDGDDRWFGTAGVADTDTGRLRRPADRFRIGSATKTFVATVALQLVGEGAFALDDTVARWLPDGDRITIRQLLNHTSGVFNYTGDQPALCAQQVHTPAGLVDIALAHPPAFPPGTDWAYSNTNYVLIGMIIEHATGNTVADEIERRIARPLGLTGTYLPRGHDTTIRGPHSKHYTKKFVPDPDATIYDGTEIDSSIFWATGGMISCAGEFNDFLGALLGGHLLGAEQQRAMFATVPTHDWIPNTEYGLGISSVRLPGGTTVWGMGGALFGSWSYAYGTRDGRHVLTVNANGDWVHPDSGWTDPIGVFTDLLAAEF